MFKLKNVNDLIFKNAQYVLGAIVKARNKDLKKIQTLRSINFRGEQSQTNSLRW